MSGVRCHINNLLLLLLKCCFPITCLGGSVTEKPLHDPDLSAQRLCFGFSDHASLRTSVKHNTASQRMWHSRTCKQSKHGVWRNCPWLTLWGTQGTLVTHQSAEHRLKRPSSSFFVLNTIFNQSQRLSRSLNYKPNFLFCNF